VDVLGELAAEPGEVQAKSLGVRQEIGGGELLLVLEQHLVHRPALALGARRLGGLGGRLGMRMHGGQGKVAVRDRSRSPMRARIALTIPCAALQ
jgi:hypothetical protein